jgi:hypothetical protein
VQFVAVAVAALGLWFLYRQVRLANAASREANAQTHQLTEQNEIARGDAKRQRTVAFQEHYTHVDFLAVLARVLAFLDTTDARDAVQKIHAWEVAAHGELACLPRTPRDPSAPMASRIEVNYVFGFYENIGAAYQLGQLDVDAFELTFGPDPANVFVLAWWWVCWRRGGRLRPVGRQTVFAGLEDLVRWSHQKDPSFDLTPNPEIRLLALPDSTYADAPTWDVCGRLSQAVGAFPLQTLAIAPARPPSGGAGGVVDRIVAVPGDLGLDPSGWLRQIKLAGALEEALRPLPRAGLERLIDALAEPAP